MTSRPREGSDGNEEGRASVCDEALPQQTCYAPPFSPPPSLSPSFSLSLPLSPSLSHTHNLEDSRESGQVAHERSLLKASVKLSQTPKRPKRDAYGEVSGKSASTCWGDVNIPAMTSRITEALGANHHSHWALTRDDTGLRPGHPAPVAGTEEPPENVS